MKLCTKFSDQFHSSKKFRIWSYVVGTVILTSLLFAFAVLFVYTVLPSVYDGGAFLMKAQVKTSNSISDGDTLISNYTAEQAKVVSNLKKQFDKLTPKANYLVINTTENRFFLYSGKGLLRAGICSTGSYTLLVQGDKKKWEFKTPKGIFKIRERKTEPVWKKPDWAFVEEGLPIPSPNHPSRYESGTLGDYALSLGDGYMIHGTLYQRFLGMAVTHGCIRLGDADLEVVFKAMPTGAKVYIY